MSITFKKTTTTILNNDMKSHDKISYICHSKYATLRVLNIKITTNILILDQITISESDLM